MASPKSDAARVKRYVQKFLSDNRSWLAVQNQTRDLVLQRQKLAFEAQQLFDAQKFRQAAAKLKQAERIHAKLRDTSASTAARRAKRKKSAR